MPKHRSKPLSDDERGAVILVSVGLAAGLTALFAGQVGAGLLILVLLGAGGLSQISITPRLDKPMTFKSPKINEELAESMTSAPFIYFVLVMLLAVMGLVDALIN